jgi:hypothetical protein
MANKHLDKRIRYLEVKDKKNEQDRLERIKNRLYERENRKQNSEEYLTRVRYQNKLRENAALELLERANAELNIAKKEQMMGVKDGEKEKKRGEFQRALLFRKLRKTESGELVE